MILTCDRDGAQRHEHIVAGGRPNGAVASVGQSRGLIILRSQVQVLPAPR